MDLDSSVFDPRSTWSDKKSYDVQAQKLVDMFAQNFLPYTPYIGEDVKAVSIGLF